MHAHTSPVAADAALLPRQSARFKPLRGVRVVSLALNLPGPVAAARLRALGAQVVKIEPPAGDPMQTMNPALYAAMHRGIRPRRLDLKGQPGQAELHQQLAQSDLLLTAFRPQALARLGLSAAALARRHPRLSTVAIVGHPPPHDDRPGHDLTYQAEAGLIDACGTPATLLADMAGALLAVEAALAALLHTRVQGKGAHLRVALADAAALMAAPRAFGLAAPGALLGGALPAYGVYRCRDGRVALAALEPHFAARLQALAGGLSAASLRRWCAAHTAAELQSLAAAHDLPLHAWALGS